MSVAAIDSSNTVAGFSQKNSQVEISAPGVNVLSTVPYVDNTSVSDGSSTFNANQIEFAADTSGIPGTLVNGGLATSGNGSWDGKIVLVQRGTNSFYDKVSNVEASGGIAAIIYNNVEGDFLGTLGVGNSSSIRRAKVVFPVPTSPTRGWCIYNMCLDCPICGYPEPRSRMRGSFN